MCSRVLRPGFSFDGRPNLFGGCHRPDRCNCVCSRVLRPGFSFGAPAVTLRTKSTDGRVQTSTRLHCSVPSELLARGYHAPCPQTICCTVFATEGVVVDVDVAANVKRQRRYCVHLVHQLSTSKRYLESESSVANSYVSTQPAVLHSGLFDI